MSAIFTSFIIEPVVRHARRFSSQGSSSTAAPARPPSSARAPAQIQSHVSASSDASTRRRSAATTTTAFSPALGIYDGGEAVIVEDDSPNNSVGVDAVAAATATNATAVDFGVRESEEHLDHRARPISAATVTSPDTHGELLLSQDPIRILDGAVDSREDSPYESFANTPDNASVNGDEDQTPPQALLQSTTPTTTTTTTTTLPATASHHRADNETAIHGDSSPATSATTMAPPTTRNTGGGRTSSARDIPRPQMSLREDSPSQTARSLPADDGMRLLRQRIHQIRSLNAPSTDKARRMHELMTAEWQAAQMAARPQSPAENMAMVGVEREKDRVFVPSSPLSSVTVATSPESVASSPVPAVVLQRPAVDPRNPYNVTPEDLQPSYRPLPEVEHSHSEDTTHEEHGNGNGTSNNTSSSSIATEPPDPVLGCAHYKRNVKIQCHDCRTWHSCRHCHDATTPSHHLNRKATENMLCMLCWTPQPAGQYCRECGERAAWYYCDICKLWDDDAGKSIYHCADCGICRRGEGLGKDFVHCKKCNVCISIAHSTTHTCIENATDSNCPLCLDYMFTSPLEIVAMPCGHYLHHACYTALMLSTYQCPICKRSAVNMETQWRKLEEEIRHQPMPREWSDVKVEVKCNDCAALSVAAFHWLGVKCGRCDGFNTSTVRMMVENEEVRRDVVEFAEARRERRSEMGRQNFRRTVTAPLTVRPYFLEDQGGVPGGAGRPRSSFGGAEGFQNPFTLPELPRLHDFSGRLPNINLAEYRDRFPNIPYPSMPGFAFPFDLGVMERVGRSLSPIRHYFDDQIVEGVPRQFWRNSQDQDLRDEDGEAEGSWKGDERWMVGSSDEEEDGEEYESEDEDEGEGEGDSDEEMADIAGLMEEDDEDEGGGLRIELTGHR